MSAGVFTVGLMYCKRLRFGPFATGTSNRAILDTTFQMSPPEVERATHRKLLSHDEYSALGAKAYFPPDWELDDRDLRERTYSQYLVDEMLFNQPCQIWLEFFEGELANYEVAYELSSEADQNQLLTKIQGALTESYQPYTPTGKSEDGRFLPFYENVSASQKHSRGPIFRNSYAEIELRGFKYADNVKHQHFNVNVSAHSLWYADEVRRIYSRREKNPF